MAFENLLYFGSFQPEKHKTETYQLKVTTYRVSYTLTYEIPLLLIFVIVHDSLHESWPLCNVCVSVSHVI